MKRVMIIICTGFVPWGGLTTVAMNYYRAMDRTGLQIDFASNNVPPQVLIDELEANGSKYYKLPKRNKIFRYTAELYKILKGYDVVHIHGNSATMTLELFPAVLRGIPMRIAHCHNSHSNAEKLNMFLKPLFLKLYTQAIAVSETAGNWLYGKEKYLVLNNAISIKKYKFNQAVRNEMRIILDVDDNVIVYGHVGKINLQKNHSFLIDIFYELKKRNPNSVLLLVGDGELRAEIETKVKSMRIERSVFFAGMSQETEKWLQAMDCFIFPSHYEGFPLAFAEAQANGLVCFGSSAISATSQILSSTRLVDLSLGAEGWANEICATRLDRTPADKVLHSFKKKHLDIVYEANTLRDLYKSNKRSVYE